MMGANQSGGRGAANVTSTIDDDAANRMRNRTSDEDEVRTAAVARTLTSVTLRDDDTSLINNGDRERRKPLWFRPRCRRQCLKKQNLMFSLLKREVRGHWLLCSVFDFVKGYCILNLIIYLLMFS